MTVQPALFDFGDEPNSPEPECPAPSKRPPQPFPRTSAAEPQPVGRLLFKPEEAAAILGVGRTKLCELLASGAVASVHIGSARRIAMTALVDYVARLHATAGGPARGDERRSGAGTDPATRPQRERPVTSLRTVGDPQPTAREQER
jgi:excisionase family DNA binding protein